MKRHNKQKSVLALNREQSQLVENNLSLAENMSKRYAGLGESRGIDRQDLEQEAALGLCEAALRFDPSRGVSFRTYAYDWCMKRIHNFIKGQPNTSLYDVELQVGDGSDDEDDEEDEGVFADDDETADDGEDIYLEVKNMLAVLDVTERKVVCLLHGLKSEPIDFRETAKRLRLTTSRVRHIYDHAKFKMEFYKEQPVAYSLV